MKVPNTLKRIVLLSVKILFHKINVYELKDECRMENK